jgi:hypothetical protein
MKNSATYPLCVDPSTVSTLSRCHHQLRSHPLPPLRPPTNREKDEIEKTSVRAEETDIPPRKQEGRMEAAGVRWPPSIPTRPQLPEASAVDREGMVVRPASAIDIEATAPTSTLLSREKQG